MAGPGGTTIETLGHESFVVRDIHCGRCAGTLEQALASTPGVVHVHVDPIIGWTSIDYDAEQVSREELRQGIEAGGYEIVTRWG